MSTEILDFFDFGIPGPAGDVTPEAIAARDAAEEFRDEAEQFANAAVALQDSAVATLLSDPGSESTAATGAEIVSKLRGVQA